ncbi:DUF6497 family protein [Gymnodinialimonas ulvae]|uniref:DUF6497 family protein n=1 Tax=Gymnodinialimonas ulvae TaxID=3126504 RepID=UPI003097A479
MIRGLIMLLAVAMIGGAAYWFLASSGAKANLCPLDESETAPSGRSVTLCDVVYEVQPSNEIWAVVRVVDRGLVTNVGHEDHDWACNLWGVRAAERDPRPARIVVQFMAEPFERGEPAPGITQSIEAYAISDDTCQWELL